MRKHTQCIDPSTSSMYQAEMFPLVLAQNTPTKILIPDGNRIAFWVAINGTVTLVAPNMISIGKMLNGLFVCYGTISTNEGDAYYSLLQYGSLVQDEVWIKSSTNNQNITFGTLTRPYREE